MLFSNLTWQRDINIPLGAHMVHKECRKDGKTFLRCYTTASKI